MNRNYYQVADWVFKSINAATNHQSIDNNFIASASGVNEKEGEYILNLMKVLGVVENKNDRVRLDPIKSSNFIGLSVITQAYYCVAAEWKSSHPKELDKGLWVCRNLNHAEILETGINPSGTENGFLARESDFANCNDRYWKRLKCIYGPDTLNKAAYLDLFPFHEADQFLAEKTNPELLKDFLLITMDQIERMNPKLIIIGNKRSVAFWGHHPKYAWMDYDFADRIPDSELPLVAQGRNLEVYQIQGFLNRPDRIHNLTSTNLRGSIVINYGYHGRIPHTMTPEITREMFLFAQREKVEFAKRNSR